MQKKKAYRVIDSKQIQPLRCEKKGNNSPAAIERRNNPLVNVKSIADNSFTLHGKQIKISTYKWNTPSLYERLSISPCQTFRKA
ncbi:hypothetical protein METP3_01614 [Methanosarcinales archaeon]|nr:hypothetical protein METP3_01614 [Methanosarcinales archaeon]